jgi:hypothetical protein
MTLGSLVTYTAHPEWNNGVVTWPSPTGLLLVDFEIDGKPYSDMFHPRELQPGKPTMTRSNLNAGYA